jgi:tetratricopeptide (TPR) repeat protein
MDFTVSHIRRFFVFSGMAVFLLSVIGCRNGKPANTWAQVADSISRIQSNTLRLEALNKALIRFQNDERLYKMRAHTYDELNQLQNAIDDAEKAIKLDSTNAENYFYVADLCMKKPYMTGAIGAMHHLLKVLPGNKTAFERLGKYYFLVKEYENSIKYLNSALKLDPNDAEALFYKGYDYKESGNAKMATLHFQKVIEVKPDYLQAYLQLGLLSADANDPKAVSYFSSALQMDPGNKGALYARGMYYQQHDSIKLALKDYMTFIHKDSSSELINYAVAYCNYLLKNYNQALHYFDRAIQINSIYEQAYYGRGLTYKALHKNAEAVADLKKSEELKGKKPASKNP